MSLLVWLPFATDIKNLGLDNTNITLTSGNSLLTTDSKLGSKAINLTAIQPILSTSSVMSGAKEMSYAFWAKVNVAWSANWLDGIRWISTDGSNTYTCRQEFYTNCTLVGTWYLGGSISGKSFTPGVWTHIAATFNYNTGIAKFYLNGILQGTTTNLLTTHYCRGDFYIGDNGVDLNENDVRIYDHCLSDKEIQEIAKGLVVHYKLDDSYAEVTTILSCNITDTAYNGTISKYGYNDDSNLIKTTGYFLGKDCVKIGTRVAGLTARPYAYFGNLFTSDGTNAPAYKALSFDYYTTVPTTTWLNIYKLGSGEGTASWKTTNSDGVYSGTYTNSANSIKVKPNEWNHIEVIFHGTTTANAEWGYCINGPDHTTSADYYFLYANIQLEQNDHTTGYGNNLHSSIVYDCSGYSHNGTFSNNLTVEMISNSPKYLHGIHLNKTKINCATGFPTGDNPDFTIVFWTKIFSDITYVLYGDLISIYDTNLGSNTFRLELCGSPAGNNLMWFRGPSGQAGGGFNMNNNSNNGWFSKDIWHLIALTGNGQTKLYICYLDGVLCGTYNGTANSWSPTGQFSIGDTVEATADFSDYRIYSTVLSPQAILELYNTSATIDNTGKVYSREFDENDNLNLTKTGIFGVSNIYDNNDLTKASILTTEQQILGNTLYEY